MAGEIDRLTASGLERESVAGRGLRLDGVLAALLDERLRLQRDLVLVAHARFQHL